METLSGTSLLALYVESLSADGSAKAALTNNVARASVITPPEGFANSAIHIIQHRKLEWTLKKEAVVASFS